MAETQASGLKGKASVVGELGQEPDTVGSSGLLRMWASYGGKWGAREGS